MTTPPKLERRGRRNVLGRAAMAVATCIATTIALFPGATVQGAGFHAYSVGRENTGGSGFTGIRVTRITTAVAGLPNTGCVNPFTGSPVYQTSWVIITGDAQNWDEIGIGHQCSDNKKYYFWGYGENGAWFPLGTANAINGASHVNEIGRAFNGSYYYDYWKFDDATKATLRSNSRAVRVEAGLESYCQGCSTVFNSTLLRYQKNEGAFVAWVDRDDKTISAGMCGSWLADTSWRSGQGGC